MTMRTRVVIFLLCGAILLGLWLRLRGLGTYSLWTDELFSVFAAKDVGQSALPHLPSGRPYSRAIIFTYAVALFGRLFGFGEIPIRFPSVLFGIALIPICYVCISRMVGRRAGLVSSFLVATCPFFVLWAQQCRMYTLFMLVYFMLVFRIYSLLESVLTGKTVPLRAWVSAMLLFGLSFSLHELTILILPATAVYCVLTSLLFAYARGWHSISRSSIGRITAGILLISCAGIFLKYQDISLYLRQIPLWRQTGVTTLGYYRSLVHDTYPLYAYLYPVSLVALMARKRRAGIYMACSFIVPFLALSLFSWKGYKYLLPVFPFFLIPVGSLFADAAGYLWTAVRARIMRYAPRMDRFRLGILNISLGCAILVALGYPALFPWIKVSPERFATFGRYRFSPYADFIKKMDSDDILICTEPFLIEYYTGRVPDYMILTRWHSEAMGDYDYSYKDSMGRSVDMNAGIPLISLEALKGIEKTGRRIWIVSNTWFLNLNPYDAEFLDYVRATYKKHPLSDRIFVVYTIGGENIS